MTKKKPYFIGIGEKRMFKVTEDGAKGFTKLLGMNNFDCCSTMIKIATEGRKEEIVNIIDTCTHIDMEDIDIIETLSNIDNNYYLTAIMNCCVRFLQETKPVATDELVITTRRFLEKLHIECKEKILADEMYAIGIYTHNEAMIPIDNMTQNFEWTTESGNYVWEQLIKKERAKAFIMFQVVSHDDVVLIDMAPSGGSMPEYIRGTDRAIKEVAQFIQNHRLKNTIRNNEINHIEETDAKSINT